MSVIAIFVVLLLTVSANTDREFHVAEGMKLPHFEVMASDGTAVSPSDLNGRFVIVNFWASGDAGSRITANIYDRYVESSDEEQVCLMSVNIDDNERLFREIVRMDGLDSESQFFVKSADLSSIIKTLDMADGLKTFLIDPYGTVVAVNPTIETVAAQTAG